MTVIAPVVAACILACLLSLIFTPVVRSLARRLRVVDSPGSRKIHSTPIPLLGGCAIFVATLVATAACLSHGSDKADLSRWLLVTFGAILTLAVGIWDDARGMRARRKLLFQIIIAGVLVAGGLRIGGIALDEPRLLFGGLSAPLTIVWIVAIMNAWNLIDGLDGLAAGLAAIASLVLGIWMIGSGNTAAAIVLFALSGACLGFVRYNFHPASIFMGDGGSLFLGYMLAVVPLLTADRFAEGSYLDARVPMLVYLVPVADTVAAIVRRGRLSWRIGRMWGLPRAQLLKVIGSPDKKHLHHALLRLGFGQRRVAVLCWVLAGSLGALSLIRGGPISGLIGAGLGLVAMMLILHLAGCLAPSIRHDAVRRSAEVEAGATGQTVHPAVSAPKRRAA